MPLRKGQFAKVKESNAVNEKKWEECGWNVC